MKMKMKMKNRFNRYDINRLLSTFEAQFIKKLSKTEAQLKKKALLIKKKRVLRKIFLRSV